ncbi:hypothetical protein ABGT15_06585 [Flavobacterium enshiense]|uniref:hypothetical protein n=1 Tax=Flavobacterium enshiense TaxID=1341165 RepID=UPI00345C96DA
MPEEAKMTLIENKKLLYDGVENEELFSGFFNVNDLRFTLSEMITNEIANLKKHISEEDFSKITQELKFQTNENSEFVRHFKDLRFFEDFYKSDEGLSVYFLNKDNCLYIFSFGEKQPGRYILNLEAVYAKNEHLKFKK